jgi:hypothetical protein
MMNDSNLNYDITILHQKIERRAIRYRKMVAHMAQINANPSNNEHISEIIQKNLTDLWDSLESAKNELDQLLSSSGILLYKNQNNQDNLTSSTIIKDVNQELIKYLSLHPQFLLLAGVSITQQIKNLQVRTIFITYRVLVSTN